MSHFRLKCTKVDSRRLSVRSSVRRSFLRWSSTLTVACSMLSFMVNKASQMSTCPGEVFLSANRKRKGTCAACGEDATACALD